MPHPRAFLMPRRPTWPCAVTGHAGAAHRGEWADGIGCLRPE